MSQKIQMKFPRALLGKPLQIELSDLLRNDYLSVGFHTAKVICLCLPRKAASRPLRWWGLPQRTRPMDEAARAAMARVAGVSD